MATRHVDIAIVGAGSAGMRAYRTASRQTDSVVLIDPGPYGTTCARVGCMPSKLLIAAADAAHEARGAHRFGADVEREPEVDGRAVMARVRAERDRFVGFVVEDVFDWPEEHRIQARARFTEDGVLEAGSERIVAKTIILAVGSRPRTLPIFEGLGDALVTNDDVFDWEDLPESVVVFGPGVVGLELGQALARLGVRVQLLGVGGLVGPFTDPVVRQSALEALNEEVPLHAATTLERIQRTDDGVTVRWVHEGKTFERNFEKVLAALGRVPNTDKLGLQNTTLPRGDRGELLYDLETMQVGDHPVFIAGDANGDRPILHEAADEGTIAAANALQWPKVTRGTRRSPLAVAFTHPQLAMVGLTHAEAMTRGAITGEVSFHNQGRSRVMLQNKGRLHIYADPETGIFLGAELAGPSAEHLGHLLAWAHQQGLTVDEMLEMPFYHPVVEEGLRTALRDAQSRLAQQGRQAAK